MFVVAHTCRCAWVWGRGPEAGACGNRRARLCRWGRVAQPAHDIIIFAESLSLDGSSCTVLAGPQPVWLGGLAAIVARVVMSHRTWQLDRAFVKSCRPPRGRLSVGAFPPAATIAGAGSGSMVAVIDCRSE